MEGFPCHCHFGQGAVLKLFPHYILGDEGDTKVQLDQVDYGRVVGELAHILGMKVMALDEFLEYLPGSAARFMEYDRDMVQLPDVDGTLAGKGVVGACYEYELLGQELLGCQLWMRNLAGCEAYVAVQVCCALYHLSVQLGHHRQEDVGKLAVEKLQEGREVVGGKSLAGGYVDPALVLGLEIPDALLHLGLKVKYLLGQSIECFSSIGKDNLLAYLVEEHQVVGVLQLLDLTGHRRLGDTQFLCGPGIAFILSYIVESLEMIKIHNKNYKVWL